MFSMDRNLQILLIAGIIITAIVFLVNIYIAGIVLIVFATIVMSYLIMQDSRCVPSIEAVLRDDARGIVIRNNGNSPAMKVHVALVPENIEFDIPLLAVDESYTHTLERMFEEVRVVVTFRNEADQSFTRSFQVSALGDNFEPLKPMIPLFRWK